MKRNSGVRNLITAAACLVGLLALQVACGSSGNSLPNAVYAKGVPVYPGAKYIGEVGGHSGGRVRGPAGNESHSWFLKVSDPADQVVAFYQGKLTGAELAKDAEDTRIFTLKPPGAEEGEFVQVIIHRNGDLQIHESLKAGKKKA